MLIKQIFSLFAVALMSASMFADPNIVTPTISGETEFTDSVIVTMSCPSPNADIYYTTDGTTDPKCDCDAAPEYKKPIIIRETTVINAAAYDGNDWSGVAEVTFTKVAARPDTAYGVTRAEEDVMALYCNHYTTNNYNFNVLGWGDVKTWETLKLGEDSTNVLYCQDMKWEMMTNWDADSYDFSGYEKFHFDVWVPFASIIKVTFEAQSGWKKGITFNLNEGWNTIDADPVWWNIDSTTYDWTDVKYIAFEGYLMPDSTSAEGNPFAFANLYWWKTPTPDYPDAPALPTISEEGVMALFCPAYTTNTVNFAPQTWGGSAWNDVDGKFFYTGAMTWDAFTNWDTARYTMYDYDTFICDIYVTVPSNIKITFEALAAGEGGCGWKNGAVVEGLQANQWNHVEVDLLNAPYVDYEFKDLRYLILEGFTNEGTPLGIANAMFVNSAYLAVENVEAEKTAVKRLIDGRLVIEKNGKRYNALGTEF